MLRCTMLLLVCQRGCTSYSVHSRLAFRKLLSSLFRRDAHALQAQDLAKELEATLAQLEHVAGLAESRQLQLDSLRSLAPPRSVSSMSGCSSDSAASVQSGFGGRGCKHCRCSRQ